MNKPRKSFSLLFFISLLCGSLLIGCFCSEKLSCGVRICFLYLVLCNFCLIFCFVCWFLQERACVLQLELTSTCEALSSVSNAKKIKNKK